METKQLKKERDEARALVARYVDTIDRIYNHNEAARQAVITHNGLWHSPLAIEICGIVGRQKLKAAGGKR